MHRPVESLVIAIALLWAAVALPARWLWGPDAVWQSAAAALLCLVPAALTLHWARRGPRPSADPLAAMLAGTLVRLGVVLGVGLALNQTVEVLQGVPFWLWLAAFYLTTLALEMTLLLLAPNEARGI